MADATRTIKVGDSVPVEELTAWLIDRGMVRVEVVEVAGEFSVRGGILDVFPPDSSDPIRVEFFGDEVESIRPFDGETQRSLGKQDSVALTAPAQVRRRRSAPKPSATPSTRFRKGRGSRSSSRPTCARRAGITSAGSKTLAGCSRSNPRSQNC